MSRGRGKPTDVPRHTIRSPFYVLLFKHKYAHTNNHPTSHNCLEDQIKNKKHNFAFLLRIKEAYLKEYIKKIYIQCS